MRNITRITCIALIISISISISGCSLYINKAEGEKNKYIDRFPLPVELNRSILKKLPEYDPYLYMHNQLNLSGYDLSEINLNENLSELILADYDTTTKWPFSMPEGFNPKGNLEKGKNPGLGIRDLHKEGYTGEGVSLAIISEPLLVDHEEYYERLVHYEELALTLKISDSETEQVRTGINQKQGLVTEDTTNNLFKKGYASYIGTALASIAVGRSSGVAPKASLYYFAPKYLDTQDDSKIDYTAWILEALNRIEQINDGLDKSKRIQSIIIFKKYDYTLEDRNRIQKVINNLSKSQGVLILEITSSNYGLGRQPSSDPDDLNIYEPSLLWNASFFMYSDTNSYTLSPALLVPIDSRTTAAPTGVNQYIYNRIGESSYASAYLAGLYVLARQKKPDLTPEHFFNILYENTYSNNIEKHGIRRRLNGILDVKEAFNDIK